MKTVTAGVVVLRAVVVLSLVLLLSFGGAIFAAPVTIPANIYSVRTDRNQWWRLLAGLSIVLTAAEVAWAAVYVSLGESSPLLIGAPVAVLVVGVAWMVFSQRHAAVLRHTPASH